MGSLLGRGVGFNPSFRKGAGGLWLRGDGIASSAGVITSWADSFGNYPAAIPVGGKTTPTVTTMSVIGGRTVSTWDGTGLLQLATFSIAQPFTVYMVTKSSSLATAQNYFDGSSIRGVVGQFASTGLWIIYAQTSQTSFQTGTTASSVTCAQFNGASSQFFLNSSANAVVASTTPGTAGPSNLYIGSSNGVNGLVGNMAELLILPGLDTAPQVTAFFNYASWYYALPGVA